MVEQENGRAVPPWVLRVALGFCVLASVPLYMVFLYSAAHRWALQLDPGDFSRTTLPIAVPGAALGFTLLAACSWWMSLLTGRTILLGRTGWRYLLAFVAVMSVTTGIIGAKGHISFGDVLFSVVLTVMGLLGVWLLPPALSPRLIDALPNRERRTLPTA